MQQRAIFRTSTSAAAPMRLSYVGLQALGCFLVSLMTLALRMVNKAEFGRIRGAAIHGRLFSTRYAPQQRFCACCSQRWPAKAAHLLPTSAAQRRGGAADSTHHRTRRRWPRQRSNCWRAPLRRTARRARRLLDSGTAPGHNSTHGGAQDAWIRRRPRAVCNRGERAACVCV